MNAFSIIAFVTVGALLGSAWHNQPARAESGISSEAPASSKPGHVDWGMVFIWSFVFLSFAAVFLAGCSIWIKCHGDWPH